MARRRDAVAFRKKGSRRLAFCKILHNAFAWLQLGATSIRHVGPLKLGLLELSLNCKILEPLTAVEFFEAWI